MRLSVNRRLERLRQLVYGEPAVSAWDSLVHVLMCWEEGAEQEMALEYAAVALEARRGAWASVAGWAPVRQAPLVAEVLGDALGGPRWAFEYIAAGEGVQGSPKSERGHQPQERRVEVKIQRPFLMLSTPVTQALWAEVDEGREGVSSPSGGVGSPMETTLMAFGMDALVGGERQEGRSARRPSRFEHPQRPVEGVSWYDAVAWCNAWSSQSGLKPVYTIRRGRPGGGSGVWRDVRHDGFRLPTSAEWEWACRAGSGEARHGRLEDIAWYVANSQASTQIVGQKASNAWGLYDMLGNVHEWCWDRARPPAESWQRREAPLAGVAGGASSAVGGDELRVLRGGSFSNAATVLRAAQVGYMPPRYSFSNLGFRCVRTLPFQASRT